MVRLHASAAERSERKSYQGSVVLDTTGMELSCGLEVDKEDYNGDPEQTRWRISLYHTQFHDRSFFYVFEDNDSAEVFVDRMRDAMQSFRERDVSFSASFYDDVRSLATSIHCFLNENPDAEKFSTG